MWNFSSSVQLNISLVGQRMSEILSRTLEDKFHISKQPCIILCIILLYKDLTNEKKLT